MYNDRVEVDELLYSFKFLYYKSDNGDNSDDNKEFSENVYVDAIDDAEEKKYWRSLCTG